MAVRLVGMSPGQRDGLRPGILDHPHGLVGVVLLVGEVRDHHVGALAREGEGDGTADARVAAGDQRRRPSSRPLPR